jgi:hypothetical protein
MAERHDTSGSSANAAATHQKKADNDPEAVRAREATMAKRLAQTDGPLVVVLPGGDHDLRGALAEHAPRARYVRVAVEAYREAAGG